MATDTTESTVLEAEAKVKCPACGMQAVDLGGWFLCPMCYCYIVPNQSDQCGIERSSELLGVVCRICGKVMVLLDGLCWCPKCGIAIPKPKQVRLVVDKGRVRG